jgi:hypothetical protein
MSKQLKKNYGLWEVVSLPIPHNHKDINLNLNVGEPSIYKEEKYAKEEILGRIIRKLINISFLIIKSKNVEKLVVLYLVIWN